MRPIHFVMLFVGLLTNGQFASAEEFYYRTALSDLPLIEGALPEYEKIRPTNAAGWQQLNRARADIRLDGDGEAFVQFGNRWSRIQNWQANDRDGATRIWIAARTSQKRDVTGRLWVPKADGQGMLTLKFRIPASTAAADAWREFNFAKIEHYDRLISDGLPGTAWFRAQSNSARKALGPLGTAEESRLNILSDRWTNQRSQSELDRTYDFFSGGRAISENLQLNRDLPAQRTAAKNDHVAINTITGITVREIDWKPLLKEALPKLDSLATAIPADQHVVFFPSFAAALKVADEAKLQGTNALRHSELAAQDTRLVARYEQQLGLSLSTLGRLIGPKFVNSVAVTGSDPYFATGTDVAVIFETDQPSVLSALLLAKIRLDATATPDAKLVTGEIDGLKFNAIRSPDRRVCSYVAELNRAVVVTNSPAQLQSLQAVQKTNSASIASLPEFLFFRQRYLLGEESESAFLFISDATIRRWCGPKWRIASSRRIRDAAVLADAQATYLDRLATGKDLKLGPISIDLPLSIASGLQLTASGVESPELGRLDFLTPISELNLDSVSMPEKLAYERWRDGYQRNWTIGFDPIALRLGIDEKRLLADLSIMPLIANSDYRMFIDITSGKKLAADAGDPHDTLMHLVMSLNVDSAILKQVNGFLAGMLAGRTPEAQKLIDPLGWLGDSIAVYADQDEFWLQLLKLPPMERAERLRRDGFRVPVAVRIAVKQPLKLAVFLAAVRAFIEQSGPGLSRWSTETYRDQSYVKITEGRRGALGEPGLEKAALLYGIIGDGLVLTPNEDLLKRAIDRQLARDQQPEDGSTVSKGPATEVDRKPKTSEPAPAWLGEHLAARVDRQLPTLFDWVAEIDPRIAAQTAAWRNLPILNEWKRRYPDLDPLAVHRNFWNTDLICPGGGRYVWNESAQTIESTVFGHPGEPKLPEATPAELIPFREARFGLTFEFGGLRTRVELEKAN